KWDPLSGEGPPSLLGDGCKFQAIRRAQLVGSVAAGFERPCLAYLAHKNGRGVPVVRSWILGRRSLRHAVRTLFVHQNPDSRRFRRLLDRPCPLLLFERLSGRDAFSTKLLGAGCCRRAECSDEKFDRPGFLWCDYSPLSVGGKKFKAFAQD